jgi:hypothetical protein
MNSVPTCYNALPFKYGEQWLVIGSPLTLAVPGTGYVDAGTGEIVVSSLSGANADTYIDRLWITPLLGTANEGTVIEIVARATDPGAIATNAAYTALTDRIPIQLSQTNGGNVILNQSVLYELPVRAQWLGIRVHPSAEEDGAETVVSILGRVASSGTENLSRYQR